jgi:O-succinylbenzoate synthase
MNISAAFYKHTLNFSFDAGTSRGVLRKKDSYFLKVWDPSKPDSVGIGEAGPLFGLSPEFGEATVLKLHELVVALNSGRKLPDLSTHSSVRFALETAFLDLKLGGIRKIFDNSFFQGSRRIAINGLIWMGTKEFMKAQILEKISSGYTTLKMKIGAIDFDTELGLLKFIRHEFPDRNLTLRVDANGAFHPNEALEKLKRLSEFELHSIEQPIAAGQEEAMASLCSNSPIPIVLDEELIGNVHRIKELLAIIRPQYIILKPTLMGGISGAKQWIAEAEELGISWWITSALESNVGLNAIAQFTAEYNNPLPQGLGTGKLYTNNIPSPLEIEEGKLYYATHMSWDQSIQSIGERR